MEQIEVGLVGSDLGLIDEFDKLISKSEQADENVKILEKSLRDLAKRGVDISKIKNSFSTAKVSSEQYKQAIVNVTTELRKSKQETDKNLTTLEKLRKKQEEARKQLLATKKGTTEYAKAQAALIKSSRLYAAQLEKEGKLNKQTSTTVGELKDRISDLMLAREQAKEGSKELDDINNELIDTVERLNTAMGKVGGERRKTKAQQTMGEAIRANIEDTRIFGISLGQMRNSLNAAKDGLGGVTKSLGFTSKALRLVRLGLIGLGIGLIIALIVGLSNGFITFKKTSETVEKALNFLGDTLSFLKTNIEGVLRLFAQIVTLDLSGAAQSVAELGVEWKRTRDLMDEVRQLQKEIEIGQSDLNLEIAEQRKQVELLRSVSQDERKTYRERISAERQIGEILKNQVDQKVALAEKELRVAENIDQTNKSERESADLREKQIAFENAHADQLATRREIESNIRSLRKESSEEYQANLEKERKALEEEQKALEKIANAYDKLIEKIEAQKKAAQLEGATPEQRVELELQFREESLTELETQLIETAKALSENIKIQYANDPATQAIELEKVTKQTQEALAALQVIREQAAEKSKEAILEIRLQENKAEEGLALSQVDLLELSESRKEIARLDVLIKFAKLRLDVLIASGKAEASVIAETNLLIEKLTQAQTSLSVNDFQAFETARIEAHKIRIQSETRRNAEILSTGNQHLDDLLTLEEKKRIALLKADKKLIQDRIFSLPTDDPQRQILQAQIESINQAIKDIANVDLTPLERLKQKIINKKNDYLRSLGIDPNSADYKLVEETIVKGVKDLANAIGEAFTTDFDAELLANEKLISLSDQRIETLRDELEAQKELKEDGLANNIRIAQEALDAETAMNEKLLEERIVIKKKQIDADKKAANAQIAINAIINASNLAVAAVNVIKDSSQQGLVGIITAAAGIALIITTFLAFRASAKKAAAEEAALDIPEFRTGTEDTGRAKGEKVDSHGGFRAILHPKERVLSEEDNKVLLRARVKNKDIPELVEIGLRSRKGKDTQYKQRGQTKVVSLEDNEFITNKKSITKKLDILELEDIGLRFRKAVKIAALKEAMGIPEFREGGQIKDGVVVGKPYKAGEELAQYKQKGRSIPTETSHPLTARGRALRTKTHDAELREIHRLKRQSTLEHLDVLQKINTEHFTDTTVEEVLYRYNKRHINDVDFTKIGGLHADYARKFDDRTRQTARVENEIRVNLDSMKFGKGEASERLEKELKEVKAELKALVSIEENKNVYEYTPLGNIEHKVTRRGTFAIPSTSMRRFKKSAITKGGFPEKKKLKKNKQV